MPEPRRRRGQANPNDSSNLSNEEQVADSTGLNRTLLFVAGFIGIFFYTIWSSLKTYSNRIEYDME